MFTSYDKAIVALIMALIFLANKLFNTSIAVDEQTVAGIVTLLTPVLVFLIPNKPKTPPVDSGKSGV